jgi:hypothetical protein
MEAIYDLINRACRDTTRLASFTIKLFHVWLFVYYTNFQQTVTGS